MIILANGKTNEVSQRTDATDALWVRLGELPGATGWQMKPQGACLGELCVPLPEDKREEWIADADDWVWFCYSEFADMVGQKHVRDGDVWSLGSVPEVRRSRAGIRHCPRLRGDRAQRQHVEALGFARPQGGAVHLVIVVRVPHQPAGLAGTVRIHRSGPVRVDQRGAGLGGSHRCGQVVRPGFADLPVRRRLDTPRSARCSAG